MAQKGAKIFQAYNKQLEEQKAVKHSQIQKLKKQMDLLLLSTHLQALNNQPQCQQCIRKQQQIDTLIKAIKSLRNPHEPSKIQQTHQSSHHSLQAQKQNEHEKKVCFSENEEILLTHSRQSECIKQLSKQIYTAQNNGSILHKLQEQNSIYRKQISELKQRINSLEKKLIALTQSNLTITVRQINNRNKSKQPVSDYGMSPICNRLAPPQTDKKHIPMFSSIRNNYTKNIAHPQQLPTISSRSHILNTNHSETERMKQSGHRQSIRSNRLKSPLDVVIRSSQQTPRRYNTRQQDMIQERRRSLNHKIKILQGQNKRLRTQMIKS